MANNPEIACRMRTWGLDLDSVLQHLLSRHLGMLINVNVEMLNFSEGPNSHAAELEFLSSGAFTSSGVKTNKAPRPVPQKESYCFYTLCTFLFCLHAVYINIQWTHASLDDKCKREQVALDRRSEHFGGSEPCSRAPQQCSENVLAPLLPQAHFPLSNVDNCNAF